MKRTRWILVLLLSAVLLLTLTACGEPEPEVSVSVTLVNRSGCDISSISITPSTSTEWDTEYVDGVFADGESIEAGLGTYKESEVPDTYNILVYNGENYILYDTSVDELDIELHDGDYIVFLPPEARCPSTWSATTTPPPTIRRTSGSRSRTTRSTKRPISRPMRVAGNLTRSRSTS